MKEQLRSIVEQWRTNRNLRFGIWAITAIVLVSLLLDFRDLLRQEQSNLLAAHKKQAQTQAIAKDTQWGQQRAQFAELRAALSSKLLHAQTVGLAQADVRTFVDEMLQKEGIKVDIVSVNPPQPAPPLPNCYSVGVSIHGALPLNQLFTLLYRLESAPYLVSVDSFLLRPGNRQSFSLECRFFTVLDAG